jgi:hypothetical protein
MARRSLFTFHSMHCQRTDDDTLTDCLLHNSSKMNFQFVVTLICVCCLGNATPFLIPAARCFRISSDIKTTAILQGIQSSQELDSQRDSTLTRTKIAEFIDSAFVDACFQLSKGYVLNDT